LIKEEEEEEEEEETWVGVEGGEERAAPPLQECVR